MTKTTLLRGASIGAVLAVGLGATAAQAADKADCTTKCVATHHHHKVVHKAPVESPLASEVASLKAQMAQLEARLDASNAAAAQAQAAAAQAQASASAAQAAAQNDDLAIKQIPGDVSTAVAALPKPKTDAIYVKGVKLTLGGFLAAESVYRSHSIEADIASSYTAIPFKGPGISAPSGQINPPNAVQTGKTSEWRETARQSRVSALAQGDVTPTIHLSGYGEMDFLGAAQTANSNESNSYNLRIRHLYSVVDWDTFGLHLLAGQTWSLVTLNSKGISPRNEVTPLSIEAQYVPGFDWARQPQIRLTKDILPNLWAAVSVENAQTTLYTSGIALNSYIPGAPAANVPYAVQLNGAAGSGFFGGVTSVNSGATTVVNNTLSLNASPDVVGKLAFEPKLAGHQMHLEVLGLYRSFTDRVYNGTTWANVTTSGGGIGAGFTAQVWPKIIDFQISGLYGQGIGRYGTSQLPDTYVSPNGALQGIKESQILAGLIFHPKPNWDVYGYAGGETEYANNTLSNTGGHGGFANVLNTSQVNSQGCFSITSTASCTEPTRYVEQATIGFWDRVYQGPFGRFQVGAQYSYTERAGFNDALNHGSPKANENMFYTSIRYYPF
jgi:hypothetical protein